LRAFLQLIEFEPPMIYRDHVREYTRPEILNIFKELELIQYTTYYSYFFPDDGPDLAKEWAARIGWNPEWRGDCHFALFRKPMTTL